jgi:hypothetical protein
MKRLFSCHKYEQVTQFVLSHYDRNVAGRPASIPKRLSTLFSVSSHGRSMFVVAAE